MLTRLWLASTLLVLSCLAQDPPKGYGVGSTVADFSLADAQGTIKSLKDYAKDKKFVVLDFWSKNCPFSASHEPRFVALDRAFADKGVQFLHIASNRTENVTPEAVAEVAEALKAAGIVFPALIDVGNKVADAFGAQVTPCAWVIDAVTLQVKYTGLLTDDPRENKKVSVDYIEAALTALLDGKEPAVTSTVATGCPIKRVKGS